MQSFVDVSDILLFLCSGEGKGTPRRQEGGVSVFIENPRTGGGGGGFSQESAPPPEGPGGFFFAGKLGG